MFNLIDTDILFSEKYIVDLSNKTIVFWCKIRSRAIFTKCGILDEKNHFISGERSYKNKVSISISHSFFLAACLFKKLLD